MALHAQKKGKRGEVEFCKWLDENLYNNELANRNYNQSDGHSSDVVTADFLFEVKRCETLLFDDWWYQVIIAQKNTPGDLIPVVAFRQNRKKLEFLIPANLIGVKLGYLRVKEKTFLDWARQIVNFKEDLTMEEERQFDDCENKTEIKRLLLIGKTLPFLADKFDLSIKVVRKICYEQK